MSQKVFTKNEVEKIIQRAIESSMGKGDSFTESDIMKIADEMNIDPIAVKKSIEEHELMSQFETAKRMWKRRKKQEFYQHFISFSIVNTFLVGIDMYFSGSITWSVFVIIAWGIGLVFDFIESFFPSEEKVEKGARKLMTKSKWKKFFELLIDSIVRK